MIGSSDGHLRDLIDGGPPQGCNLALARRVDSTNRWARRLLDRVADPPALSPCLLIAWEQSEGRGRQGRSWSSPAGCGLYASLLIPTPAPERLILLPLAAAVGLCRVLDRLLPATVRLKWPNDLMVGGRKLGGILVESVIRGDRPRAAILGFGVNYEWPAESDTGDRGGHPGHPPSWTCLAELGVGRDRLPALSRDLATGVLEEVERADDAARVLGSYRALSTHTAGDRLRFHAEGRLIEGTFVGFDERGYLKLEQDGERRLLAAGELVES